MFINELKILYYLWAPQKIMKKITLLIVLVLLCISSFAQKIQFCDSSNVWSMVDSTIGCCVIRPTQYTTAYYDSVAPVSYNGHSWRTLVSLSTPVLVREDSGRVYVISTADSTERILYDFNLGLNDTIRTIYPLEKYTAWITQIDSTRLAGIWYKVWHFEGLDSVLFYTDSAYAINYDVIEGIGCTNGVYYPAAAYYRNSFFEHLLCFSNDLGITSALSNPVPSYGYGYIGDYFDNGSSCSQYGIINTNIIHGAGIKNIPQQGDHVSVIPNPMNETGKLVCSYTISSGSVIVINSLGQEVINLPFRNTDEVFIGDKIKLPGIYFYRVMDNESGKTFSGKFVR